MKFRQGFVTNSSSSSFIVSFDKIPKTPSELKEMLFGQKDVIGIKWINTVYSTEELAQIIFDDLYTQLKSGTKLTDEEKEFLNWDLDLNQGDLYGFLEEDVECFLPDKTLADIVALLEDENTFYFYYADEFGGINIVLEHGNVFEKLKHYRISHH